MSVWDFKRIQMKMSSTTKLYNFSKSTTSVLVIYPLELVWNIRILSLENLDVIILR